MLVDFSGLKKVARTGSYSDLINQPTITSGSIIIDTALSENSTNPVQNKAIAVPLNKAIADVATLYSEVIGKFTTVTTPEVTGAGGYASGSFNAWYGFSRVSDLEKDGILKSIIFYDAPPSDMTFNARISKKVRDASDNITGLTTLRTFSFVLPAGSKKADVLDLNLTFEKDAVLEIYYTSLNVGIIRYKTGAATGDFARFNNQVKTSGAMWTVDVEIMYGEKKQKDRRPIKVLSVGNSYAEDAFSYVPFILRSCCPSVELTLGILYCGGCSLQQHESHFDTAGDTSYAYRKIMPTDSKWKTPQTATSIQYTLEDEDWDVIVFQQNGAAAGNYSSFQPYLNSLIRKMQAIVTKPVRFGWHIVEPFSNVLATSVTQFESYATAAQKVLDETLVDIIFPSGTSLQNARTTSLQSLGAGGNMMYSDNHAQEGIPCYALALPNALVIADLCGFASKGIVGDPNIPTQEWINARAIPNPNGSSVGATQDNCYIAQLAAVMAYKKPFVITDLTELGIV